MEMADLVVMLFMLARVVSYLSKGQKAYQQVVVRESAYWALVHAIDVAHEQREPAGGGRHHVLARQIEFEHVGYAHGGRKRILQDVSLRIPARGLTLLIGPSGSGRPRCSIFWWALREPDAGPHPHRWRAAERTRAARLAPPDRLRAAGIGDGG